jgi:polyisoprenoid-binding protein YceI
MKKIALLAVLFSGLAFGQTKKVVSSDVHWWGYKLAKTAASSHDGTINLKNGNIVLKNNKVVGGTFVLDMTTISSTDLQGDMKSKLDGHLKNGDFFEVEKFPTAVYKITSVKPGTKAGFNATVHGNLTVKGKTAAVSFPANITVGKAGVSLVSDKFSFDRQVFGVAYKSSMQDIVIKDDVDMTVKVVAK